MALRDLYPGYFAAWVLVATAFVARLARHPHEPASGAQGQHHGLARGLVCIRPGYSVAISGLLAGRRH